MAWAKLDDQFFLHRKVIDLSKDAKLLFLAALCYCAAQSRNGVLSPASVRLARASVDASPSAVSELVSAGLWEPTGGDSYRIHDFNYYNPSEKKVEQTKEGNAERQRRHRERQRNGVTNAVTDGIDNDDSNASDNGVTSRAPAFPSPSPSPSPLPVPIPVPPPPTPSVPPEPVPVPDAGQAAGGENSPNGKFPEGWGDAESISPDALLARYRDAFPQHESRLAAALGSANGPVRSQAKYLRPFILRMLSGEESDPITPAVPSAATGSPSPSSKVPLPDDETIRLQKRYLDGIPPEAWPELEQRVRKKFKIRISTETAYAEMQRLWRSENGAGNISREISPGNEGHP